MIALVRVDHLPAYLVIERWAPGRVVVVVAPGGPEGPRRLRDAGARVIVVGALASPGGLDVRPGVPSLPLPDGSAHVVVCLEGWADLAPSDRARLVGEARRVLASDGLFAAWARQPGVGDTDAVDFWSLEREVAAGFERVQMFAQLPWQGFSLAPVLDDDRAPPIVVREALLVDAPQATHYLALAGGRAAESRMAEAMQCVLVPLDRDPVAAAPVASAVAPAAAVAVSDPRVDETARELAAVRAELVDAQQLVQTRETDVAVLTRSLRELEQASLRNGDRAEQRGRELDERNVALAELRGKLDRGTTEREQLARQLEVAAVEREAAKQLAVRLETEIDLARRRVTATEEQLGERITEASRLGAEVSMLRERVEQQERALVQARARADELAATAAKSAEQGRVHAEIAFDRDRLREELARRTATLEKLEEKLWSSRDDAQRDRIEVVRITAEIERVRDQLERARQVENDRAAEIERLGAELRRTEVERAEALAAVRTREEEGIRLRRELDAMASRSGDLQRLREELDARARELAELGTRAEQAALREREAQTLARRREQQLVEAGVELERLRAQLEDNLAQGSGLQGELDVRLVELEQLAASVGDLQHQVEATRIEHRETEARATELQTQLEQAAAEREMLRRLLREREQELDDVASAQESSGAELFLLRRELDAVAEVNERLTGVLHRPSSIDDQMQGWPDAAVAEVLRLRGELAAATEGPVRERGEEVTPDRARMRRWQLEVEIRAQEHEQVLSALDAAEQRIWEMSDATDRNAARLAAGLAQLEKQREQFDDTLEELEVTRNLLAAAQARAIEQSRLLASERAKLARLGMGEGSPRLVDSDGLEDLFAELDEEDRTQVDVAPILLPTPMTLAPVAAVAAAAADGTERRDPERRDPERRITEIEPRQEPRRAAPEPERRAPEPPRRPGPEPGVPTPHSDTGPAGTGSRPIDLSPSVPRVVVEPLSDDAWREPD